ncbi:MAG TPA: carbohydrate kinase [Alphaproteobacteria bacterium]|nr:carbohydrate kinase [Alphaproteobacteria bacterium]
MIVSCGEALIDFVPMAGADGAAGYRPCPGGSPFNVAIATSRLGAPAGFLGCISTDFFGDLLVDTLHGNRVDTRLVARHGQPTTLGFVSLDQTEPQYAFFSNGAADRSLLEDDVPDALPDEVACLQFGSISLMQEPAATTLEALMRRESGRRVLSLDPNVRASLIPDRDAYRRRLEGWIGLVDLVKVSQADLDWLHPGESVEEVAARWRELGPTVVVVTTGSDGAFALTPAGVMRAPGVHGPVVDTVGAGDTFHGGLLARLHAQGLLDRQALALATGQQVADALSFANMAAAITCARRGNDPPRIEEVA